MTLFLGFHLAVGATLALNIYRAGREAHPEPVEFSAEELAILALAWEVVLPLAAFLYVFGRPD